MNNTQEEKKPKTKTKKALRIALIVLLVLLSLCCILILTGAVLFHRYYSLMQYEEIDSSIPSLTEEEISAILDKLYGDGPDAREIESEL